MDKEQKINGIPSSSGIAIGRAVVLKPESVVVPDEDVPKVNIFDELIRFDNAVNELVKEITELFDKVKEDAGTVVSILETTTLIISDPMLHTAVKNRIENGISAESAVVAEFDRLRQFFKHSNDAILRERAVDLDQIKQKLLSVLRRRSDMVDFPKDSIVVAQSLTPSDIIKFREVGVIAFITEIGGITSHASILARTFDIPAVIGVHNAVSLIKNNDNLIVDGFSGLIYNNATKKTFIEFSSRQEDYYKNQNALGKLTKLSSETKDGRRIQLQSNIDYLDDASSAAMYGSEGFGLVRTENLIISLQHFPTEEEQYKWYKQIADRAFPAIATFRVFDVGSDKHAEGMPRHEENPALGFRGIRFLLKRKDIFKSQIRAILRVSNHKNIRIMLPMISNIDEVIESQKLIEQCKKELRQNDEIFDGKIPVGVMIETPAAVMLADKLAEIAQFFSIGTNDLTQYSLAADRTNELVADVYDAFHPSIIRMIKMTVDVAHKHNITVGICGEIAGHSASTSLLVGLGIDAFSVAPSTLLETKKRIRETDCKKATELAEKVLNSSSHDEIRELLELDLEKNSDGIGNWAITNHS